MDLDRRLLTRSADELEAYLSSKVLLWRVTGVEIPLCPGNLLLACHRLRTLSDSTINLQMDSLMDLLNLRKASWEKKVNRELPMRVRQWKELVEDYNRESRIDSSYIYNVRTRVIIDLLISEARFPDQVIQMDLEKTDEMLFVMTKNGEFVWDQDLIDSFPNPLYPYLYRQTGR